MSVRHKTILTSEKALIFRITHRRNIPWILRNGVHCASSDKLDSSFDAIGNEALINKRGHRRVEVPPGGTLADYIPFYFTPHSPMLYNLQTGHNDIQRRSPEELVFLVTSLDTLEQHQIEYLFTDRHAFLATAEFHRDRAALGSVVDYPLLRSRNFQRSDEDPEKIERYQAEALVHRFLPVEALLGIGCYNQGAIDEIQTQVANLDSPPNLHVARRQGWYFSS